MITIVIMGEPIAQIRPRVCKKATFDPQKHLKTNVKWDMISQLHELQKNSLPFKNHIPISIEIDFCMAPLKKYGFLHDWRICDNVDLKDVDNMGKFYTDCMTGIIYEDDRQINSLVLNKYYDENPRTEIRIMDNDRSLHEKIKEFLAEVSPDFFIDFSEDLIEITRDCGDWGMMKEADYFDIAIIISKFAEKYADPLKKINKKFPKFANLLIREKNKRGVK